MEGTPVYLLSLKYYPGCSFEGIPVFPGWAGESLGETTSFQNNAPKINRCLLLLFIRDPSHERNKKIPHKQPKSRRRNGETHRGPACSTLDGCVTFPLSLLLFLALLFLSNLSTSLSLSLYFSLSLDLQFSLSVYLQFSLSLLV